MKEVTPGYYKHFKGGVYQVLGTGLHTETKEKLVVYIDVQDSDVIWCRPLSMFLALVLNSEGTPVKRFSAMSEEGH